MSAFRLASGSRVLQYRLQPQLSQITRRKVSTTPTSGSSPSLRTGLYAAALAVSTGVFAIYYFDSRSSVHRYVLTPLLRNLLDAETSHKVALKILQSGIAPRDTQADDKILQYELWGDTISNPVGMAAGFDKDGEAVDGLFNLGFSWVEIGSVTPKPQPGNPRPRVFRLPSDEAVINRYGFPSDGHPSVLNRLRARIPLFYDSEELQSNPASLKPGTLLAVNLGKNKSSPPDSISDFIAGVHAFAPYADVLVVNVSSPNTPGLRGLQSRALLEELLLGVKKAREETVSAQESGRKPKIVLKIAPDLTESEISDIAQAIRLTGVDGVIVSNTTTRRPTSLHDVNKLETGGLSGPPLKSYSLAAVRILRSLLPAEVPIFGCGGISSGADALEYARAGATAIQLYTSFSYEGVGTPRRIKDELVDILKREGTTWAEVVKKAVTDNSFKEPPPVGKVQPGEGSVEQLIEEAKELKGLLETLGERLGTDITADGTPEHSAKKLTSDVAIAPVVVTSS